MKILSKLLAFLTQAVKWPLKVFNVLKPLWQKIANSKAYQSFSAWTYDPKAFYVKDMTIIVLVLCLFAFGGVTWLRKHDAKAASYSCAAGLKGDSKKVRELADEIASITQQCNVIDHNLKQCLGMAASGSDKPVPVAADTPAPKAPVVKGVKKVKKSVAKPVATAATPFPH